MDGFFSLQFLSLNRDKNQMMVIGENTALFWAVIDLYNYTFCNYVFLGSKIPIWKVVMSALFECRYDVLNHMVVQCSLHSGSSYEVDLAIKLLQESPKRTEKELDIYDRGYASYEFLSQLTYHQRQFVIRMPSNSFKATKDLFSGARQWSKVVCLKAPKDRVTTLKEQGLPTEISVRFVSVLLWHWWNWSACYFVDKWSY